MGLPKEPKAESELHSSARRLEVSDFCGRSYGHRTAAYLLAGCSNQWRLPNMSSYPRLTCCVPLDDTACRMWLGRRRQRWRINLNRSVKLKGCNLKISERDFCPSVSISGTVAVPPRRFWVASSWEAKLTISFHVLCTLLIIIVYFKSIFLGSCVRLSTVLKLAIASHHTPKRWVAKFESGKLLIW